MCIEAHKEPRLLPCLHAFCTKCLQDLLDKIQGGEKLICPNCRGESDPPLSAKELPLDHAVQRALEFHSFTETAEEEKAGPCKNCEEEGEETVAYCSECGGGICDECVQLHKRRMKAFREHEYVLWEDLSEVSFDQRRGRNCEIHDFGVQLFCEECNSFICSMCLRERHMTHAESAVPLAEVREKRLAEVGKMKDTAERQFCLLEFRLEELRQMEAGLTDYPKNLELSITQTFGEYVLQLRVWCNQIITEARERCGQMAKTLSEQQTDTENAMERLKTGLQFAQRAVSCTRDDAVIEMSGMAINQLKGTVKDCEIAPPKRPLVFQKKKLSLGRLREIKEEDIEVHTPDYCFMNTDNRITVKFAVPMKSIPVIKILYGSQKQHSVTLTPTAPIVDNACSVDFFPRCAGKHTVEVWVGGAMCRRCDDAMVVRGAPQGTSDVQPGPDWRGDKTVVSGVVLVTEQDMAAPQGFGVLVEVDGEEQETFKVKVQWDSGDVIEYKWGNNDEYELELKTDP